MGYAVNSSRMGRYHIRYIVNNEWHHEYDVGTRERYGIMREHDPEGPEPRFLEDFMEDYEQVEIVEAGDGVYHAEKV